MMVRRAQDRESISVCCSFYGNETRDGSLVSFSLCKHILMKGLKRPTHLYCSTFHTLQNAQPICSVATPIVQRA